MRYINRRFTLHYISSERLHVLLTLLSFLLIKGKMATGLRKARKIPLMHEFCISQGTMVILFRCSKQIQKHLCEISLGFHVWYQKLFK